MTDGGIANSGQSAQGILEMGRCRLVDQLAEVSEAVRDTGSKLGPDTAVSRITGQVAESLQRAGDYIGSAEPRALAHDVNGVARKQPELFLGGAFVAGLLLGRFLRAQPVDDAGGMSSGADEFSADQSVHTDAYARMTAPARDETPEAGSW